LKSNPRIKKFGWENFKKIVKIVHDNYLPPVQSMTVNNGHIYIRTNNKKGDNTEFMILDNNGKEIKRVFLPIKVETSFISKVFGTSAKFYKFYNDKYYYVVENEEVEEWEIHSINLI